MHRYMQNVHIQVFDWVFCGVSGLEYKCLGAEGGGGGPGGKMAEECLQTGSSWDRRGQAPLFLHAVQIS